MKTIFQFVLGLTAIVVGMSVLVSSCALSAYSVWAMLCEVAAVWREGSVGTGQALWFFLVWPLVGLLSALVAILCGVFVCWFFGNVIDETRASYIRRRRRRIMRDDPGF
jgi:hypothetical protein